MVTLKCSGPYWSNPPFLNFFDIRALWRSGLSARMLNTLVDSFSPLSQKVSWLKGLKFVLQFATCHIFKSNYVKFLMKFQLKPDIETESSGSHIKSLLSDSTATWIESQFGTVIHYTELNRVYWAPSQHSLVTSVWVHCRTDWIVLI